MDEKINESEQKIYENDKINNKEEIKKLVFLIIVFLFVDFFTYFAFLVTNNARHKPIIYLYPTQEEIITVSLGHKENITSSYPKYYDNWRVLAKPNGDLNYIKTNQNLYGLYYESTGVLNYKVKKEGFCVEGKDIASFLEDKLAKLGLNEREAEEFIIYWLPKLENNKYNYIRFASKEEIDNDMPLIITPSPDTTIRVLMTFKGLNRPINVKEQIIETPERKGFVAVEWGGTEIN